MIFKQAFRIAFIALIWKQYKHIIVSTLLLFAYLFLVSSLHSDYLTHAELQQDASGTGISFIYKWLAFAAGIVGYFLFHWIRGRRTEKNKAIKKTGSTEVAAPETDEDDPFAEIRKRKTLRSRADFLEGKD